MIVLDTCALIWWTLDPEKLSNNAQRLCRSVVRNGGMISSISIWEIGIKIQRARLDIGATLSDYVKRLKLLEYLTIVPVDESVWLENLSLDWAHRDPADRTIVATARIHGARLLTADEMILSYYRKAVW